MRTAVTKWHLRLLLFIPVEGQQLVVLADSGLQSVYSDPHKWVLVSYLTLRAWNNLARYQARLRLLCFSASVFFRCVCDSVAFRGDLDICVNMRHDPASLFFALVCTL